MWVLTFTDLRKCWWSYRGKNEGEEWYNKDYRVIEEENDLFDNFIQRNSITNQ